ncbi:hypothetical protein AGABI1DRAFT_129159 [Agaricus bisporus var. burnettii JB137-S8]|uniref:Uncharacterized protein n=1 Tax=Agaricus bisporus var. burnettii (strain JB137-S8 / ATCC MYA-4627 / FGSC 10392) TaxID=597362 RepID=K5XUU1_AGABU|nr:uncharacterized protein AGABI1DRAFT_129159 [Agaricus bisporus var. burnettii JB137-S8]EKM78885.1 hypothetical protein AGABI1DRAFT_129159 [Agaricus bisporus var. burnettii JB137-S8]
MATSIQSPDFLNPDVYLNRLPPEGAHNYEISRNVTFVFLGLLMWDILVYIEDDIEIIRRNRIRAPTLCFIFARVFAAAYILASSIQLTSSVDSQVSLLYGALVLCALAIGCSSFLFLRRVQAVYADHKYVQWFFSVLWLVCFACEVFILIEISPSNIPGTNRFQDTGAKPTFTISIYGVVVFDTCVFLAISYKLAKTFVGQRRVINAGRGEDGSDIATPATMTTWAWWSTAISGKALPRLSRAILQGGQQYYLLSLPFLALRFSDIAP